MPEKSPDDNGIRFIPSLETGLESMISAPYPPCRTTSITTITILTQPPPIEPILTQIYDEHDTSPYLDTKPIENSEFSSILSTLKDPQHIQHIPPSDRVSSTEPNTKFMTTEFLQKCTWFRNIERIVNNLKSLTQNTVILRDTGNDLILSWGEAATLPKRNKNSTAVLRPQHVGDIFHYDISYGNGRAIGDIHYVLFLVCRKTRNKYVFGLKNLEHDTILQQMKKFIRTIGKYPLEMIADHDFHLIGQAIDNFLEPHTQVSGAPSGRQNQNGLSESNWRYICNIARNYMAMLHM